MPSSSLWWNVRKVHSQFKGHKKLKQKCLDLYVFHKARANKHTYIRGKRLKLQNGQFRSISRDHYNCLTESWESKQSSRGEKTSLKKHNTNYCEIYQCQRREISGNYKRHMVGVGFRSWFSWPFFPICQVDLVFRPNSGLPATRALLSVMASPQSLCGLRAVDQSVLLMKPETELSASLVSPCQPWRWQAWEGLEQGEMLE